MALIDDINNLPTTVGDGNTGHLNNHQVIHAALKDHEQRLGARHFIGTGSPEGRITATIGTQYTDQAATNGAIRWIKTSGTGATGWVVEYGDTGWRDITGQYSADTGETGVLELGTGAKVLIRRASGDVYFRLTGPITARSAFGSIVQLLTGWRPEVDTEVAFSRGVGIRHTRYWISLEGATSGASIAISGRSVVGQWPTMETWPTSLPGTPA